jgi:hypothetical protein
VCAVIAVGTSRAEVVEGVFVSCAVGWMTLVVDATESAELTVVEGTSRAVLKDGALSAEGSLKFLEV